MKNWFRWTWIEIVIALVVVVVLVAITMPTFEKSGSRTVPARATYSTHSPSTAATESNHTHRNHSRPSIAGTTSEQSDEQNLDRQLQDLKRGNLAYNTPETMKTGETARVTARIGSEKVSVATLKSGLPDDGNTTALSTPVSTKMKMTLKSADFDITPLSSEEQFVTGDTPTTWAWDLSPKRSGKLHLHLAAIVELNGLSKDFTAVDRDIEVKVDPLNALSTFFQSNTVWVLGVLGAAATAIWGWFRKRKSASADVKENA
ncbi:MAG: hypothetical protein JSS87_01925 [Acidobacteria bacterium]|nr:hypothetical protein [Acidobacteriota bacterium]